MGSFPFCLRSLFKKTRRYSAPLQMPHQSMYQSPTPFSPDSWKEILSSNTFVKEGTLSSSLSRPWSQIWSLLCALILADSHLAGDHILVKPLEWHPLQNGLDGIKTDPFSTLTVPRSWVSSTQLSLAWYLFYLRSFSDGCVRKAHVVPKIRSSKSKSIHLGLCKLHHQVIAALLRGMFSPEHICFSSNFYCICITLRDTVLYIMGSFCVCGWL